MPGDNTSSIVKKAAEKLSKIGPKIAVPQDDEAAGIKAVQDNVNDYWKAYGMPKEQESTGNAYSPSPKDKINSNARYGDRSGEKRIPDEELTEMTKPLGLGSAAPSEGDRSNAPKPATALGKISLPSFDEGGDVPKDEVAVVHEGEKVLNPEEAEAYRSAESLPVDSRKAPNFYAPLSSAKPKESPLGSATSTPQQTNEPAPASEDLIKQDKENAAKSGDLVGFGKAVINEKHFSPASPFGSALSPAPAMPVYGGPGKPVPQGQLIPEKQRPQDERKFKLANYDQSVQQALDTNTPEGQEQADHLKEAKLNLEKNNPR